jgi:hypothetical protein
MYRVIQAAMICFLFGEHHRADFYDEESEKTRAIGGARNLIRLVRNIGSVKRNPKFRLVKKGFRADRFDEM